MFMNSQKSTVLPATLTITFLPIKPNTKRFSLKQDIPLWAYIDLFTISDISFLYSISEQPIKDAVAHTFGLTMSKGASILGSYMHSMTIIRNLCAHGSRIYNRLFEQKPSLNKKEKALLIKDSNGNIDNAHFYSFLLIMKRLLPADKFNEMKKSIVALTKSIPLSGWITMFSAATGNKKYNNISITAYNI